MIITENLPKTNPKPNRKCDECDEHVMGTNPTPTDQDSEKLSKLIYLIESFHTKLIGFEDSQKRIEDKVDRSFNLLG